MLVLLESSILRNKSLLINPTHTNKAVVAHCHCPEVEEKALVIHMARRFLKA